MSDVIKELVNWRAKQYEEAIGGRSGWVAHHSDPLGGDHVEISVVHTSAPHGLISWGWDGEHKMVLFETRLEDVRKSRRLKIHEKQMKIAVAMAAILNLSCPEGLPE